MSEIYLVTAGDYSDYRVEGVYADRALAEQHLALLGANAAIDARPVETGPATRAIKWTRYYRLNGTDDIYEYPEVLTYSESHPFPRPEVHEHAGQIVVEGYDRAAVDHVYGERTARRRAERGGVA